MEAFLVGGAVRDQLLGLDPKDRDWVVVGSTTEQMEAHGFKQVGADFPVFLHPETGDEFALARTERKSGTGHTAFEVDASTDVTLVDDLLRRDLTINAMAMDGDTLVDPFDGFSDLKDGVLRHVSAAFSEDPLRVLRVARFAARFPSFEVDLGTLALMRELVEAGEMEHLTSERVWAETAKALMEEVPSRFFNVLHEVGALERVFPELAALAGVPQPAAHHPEVDTFVHVMLAVDHAAAQDCVLDVRLAVLLHDLGKGVTPTEELPQHRGHESTGVPLVAAVCDRLRVSKDRRKLCLAVCEFHLHCHRLVEMRPGKVLKLLQALDGFRKPEMVDKFVQACEADARGRTGLEDRDFPQAELLVRALVAAKAVSTAPLLERGFTGKKLGALLDQERIRAVKGAI